MSIADYQGNTNMETNTNLPKKSKRNTSEYFMTLV